MQDFYQDAETTFFSNLIPRYVRVDLSEGHSVFLASVSYWTPRYVTCAIGLLLK